MKTRIISALAAAALLTVGVSADASAVTLERARWQGTFDVKQTYLVNELNPETVGEQEERVHVIKSSCAGTKACGTVRFSRALANGDKVVYPLKRTDPGTYKGSNTMTGSWWCTIGDERVYTWSGEVDESLTLNAKAQRNGRVSKYRGTLQLLYPPYEISDEVPQVCQDYFADQGFEEGHRPEVKLSLAGVHR